MLIPAMQLLGSALGPLVASFGLPVTTQLPYSS